MQSAQRQEEETEYLVQLMKRIAAGWEPASVEVNFQFPFPAISFLLGKNGFATQVSIIRSSGIFATDLSCIDSILTAQPFPATDLISDNKGSLITCDFFLLKNDKTGFWAATGKKGSDVRIDSRFNDCAAASAIRPYRYFEPAFCLHLIPPSVLVEHPGLLDETEIHSNNNLRLLPLSSADCKLREIRARWLDLIVSESPLTRELVLSFACDIDKQFEQFFSAGGAQLRMAHAYFLGPRQSLGASTTNQ
jgi:hypothetical protein